MILKQLILYTNGDASVVLPDKYREKYPYILYIHSDAFYIYNKNYLKYEFKLPFIKEFMRELKVSDRDYVAFGESESFGWSDAGCKVYYAVATRKPIVLKTYEEMKLVADNMWNTWAKNNNVEIGYYGGRCIN